MVDDSGSIKAAFDKNWVSATKVGEYLTQSNGGDWIRALTTIREAIIGGCPAILEWEQDGQKTHTAPSPERALKFWSAPDRLRWVNALNPSFQRINFPDRPWPWEVRAYLWQIELWELRHIEGLPATPRVFLHRAEAIKWGLLPSSPDKRPTAAARAQNAPEQPEALPPTPAADTTSKRRAKKRVKRRAKKRVKRRGPDRYSKSDRALFPEITRRMKKEHLSAEEAAGQLSTLGKIKGRGNPDSRKHRLAKRYRNECGKPKTP